ncbi:MAG TPA: hypothetical protein VF533_13230 [Solirubrobacteraceae bacterium]|jgi:transcriptional regulator with XRE-family HTH domain
MSTTDLVLATAPDAEPERTSIESYVINETPQGGAIENWAQHNERSIDELPGFGSLLAQHTPVRVEQLGTFQIRGFPAVRSHLRLLQAAFGQPLALHLTVPTVGHTILAATFGSTIEDALRFKARYWHEDRPSAQNEPVVEPSRAYRTFRELMEMLSASQAEAAAAVGLSRGAVDTWRRGREPQPRNARRLYRTHTMLKTLKRRLGGHAELQHWLEAGTPSAREMLLAGDLDAVDRMVSEIVFAGAPAASERIAAHVEELVESPGTESSIETPATAKPRRVKRRPPRRRAS